jgi:hypothetical protein
VRSLVNLAIAGVFLIAVAPAGAAQPRGEAGAPEPPTTAEIAQAAERVKADPNLATERTINTLAWKTGAESPGVPGWLRWLQGLFRWIGASTRLMVWAVVVVLAAFLVVFLLRVVHERQHRTSVAAFVAPTHVRDLDIRPETLPPDIGAAARSLWDRGDHRAALALLYRGLLSRLAHVHRVPIRDSSTEGDCLALADSRLQRDRCEYVSRLIGVWQRAVYGRETVPAAAVYTLCDGFAAALDPAPDAGAAGAAR